MLMLQPITHFQTNFCRLQAGMNLETKNPPPLFFGFVFQKHQNRTQEKLQPSYYTSYYTSKYFCQQLDKPGSSPSKKQKPNHQIKIEIQKGFWKLDEVEQHQIYSLKMPQQSGNIFHKHLLNISIALTTYLITHVSILQKKAFKQQSFQ